MEGLREFYSPSNIFKEIKPRKMGWMGHVVHIGR
jgi:hypothetical protein